MKFPFMYSVYSRALSCRFLQFGLCLLVVLLFFAKNVRAQLLTPLQPEQDACHALLLCGKRFFTPYSYQGIGALKDVKYTPCGGSDGEGNSLWLKIIIDQPGSVVFSIIPLDTMDDYDFVVIDGQDLNCEKIPYGGIIRCNFNNNLQPNPHYTGGIVGLDSISTVREVAVGADGKPFLQQLMGNKGDIYLIMINNFGRSGYGPSSGFTIDFSGSTATFVKEGPPVYDSLPALACGEIDSLSVVMNKAIYCQSIASDGSDFQIEPPVAQVTSATGANCNGGAGYTKSVALTFSNPLPEGHYTLRPRKGTDGNTLLDLCDQEQLLDDAIAFQVVDPLVDAGPDTTTCVHNSVSLNVMNVKVEGNQVKWSPATYLNKDTVPHPVCTPLQDIRYVVTVTPDGRPDCAVSDSILIRVLQGFAIRNPDTLICLGQSVLLQVLGDDRYTYQWMPSIGGSGPLAPNLLVKPDSTTNYTLRASYSGCRDSLQSVVISVDSGLTNSFYFTKDKERICAGETIYFSAPIDPAMRQLSWDFGDGAAVFLLPDEKMQHAYSDSGTYAIRLKADFSACPDTAVTDTVFVVALPRVNLGPDTAVCLNGTALVLQNWSAVPGGAVHYLWSTGDTTTHIRILHPGTYSLRLGSEPMGCTAEESIVVRKDCYLDMPNAFSPDGDGINDYFFPRQLLSQKLSYFRMQIFDRWGKLIFETTQNDGRGWDGRGQGKDQVQGVYIYTIDAEVNGMQREQYHGNVTLIR